MNYSYTFWFEDSFDHDINVKWMVQNWKTHCTFYVVFYLLMVLAGRLYMSSRSRYELQIPLIIWNIGLATFSIVGALRTLPELVHVVYSSGFYDSVCIYNGLDKVSGVWRWLFVLSKVVELGDTLFIVLRKQTLIFLHWYHHATVLTYCWYSFGERTSNDSKWILDAELPCQMTQNNISVSLIMYASYFVLFAQFFYGAYVKLPESSSLSLSSPSWSLWPRSHQRPTPNQNRNHKDGEAGAAVDAAVTDVTVAGEVTVAGVTVVEEGGAAEDGNYPPPEL
ncbi:unnamed protein product [Cyprideis torosa]|uniref:Elongation of very long chain fatty acids protein n=1 Tax=Cyprideis torosa TaxID=163714 RepID=A0A7R8ZQB0_9CRUS|nr:unnamed protein product [Cyprideis torosa]CAG0902497.1 unnamed protein product [Cyprideis torosa]